MIKFYFYVFVTLLFASASADNCIPKSVTNISLDSEGTLTWTVREDETCDITHFYVYIVEPESDVKYEYTVVEARLNVDFLSPCQRWYFTVTAFSDEISGAGHTYITIIPIPPDGDISIDTIDVQHDHVTDEVEINWKINNIEYANCSLAYRLTVSGDDENVIHDLYTISTSRRLGNLSPCVSYEFGVRVINYISSSIIEGPLKSIDYEYPGHLQSPPLLASVTLGATQVNLTWLLEPIEVNRCPIREFFLNGGAYFNVSLEVHDTDQRVPVQVQVNSLRPNSMYLLKASVQNSAGWSNPATIAVQTLELNPSVN